MNMADPDTPTHSSGPYGDHALRYHAAGWSPLPVPLRTKKPVPTGYTGARGTQPSGADVYAWTEDRPDSNIALRLPPHVIGIDIDHYDGKPGGAVLAQLETTLGALPATWRSTSRDDGHSGIRLYRIPEGLRWPGGLGPGIDTIRWDHRYMLTWPSIHPDGGTYRWITPDGQPSIGDIPDPDTLPDLPEAWVQHFTGGEASTEQDRAGLDTAAANAWANTHGAGAPCKRITDALTRGLQDLATSAAGSRHDTALRLTNRLAWLAGEGHPGLADALTAVRAAWMQALAGERGPDDASAELDRMIRGAIDIAAAAHPAQNGTDPCHSPAPGILAPATGLRATAAATPTGPGHANNPTPPSSPSSASPAASPTTSPPTSSNEDEPAEAHRTTWWPRNADEALDDDNPEPPPAFLTRDDGNALFYAGRVNGIVAPSESGKTWVALLAVVQAANAGMRATILDFEDSHKGITGRLRALGMTKDDIRAHVAYIGPDEPLNSLLPTGLDLTEHLRTWAPHLIVLDGFNAAMTLQGLDLISNKDATAFAQTLLKPLAATGACVVYIDHTPKDTENKTQGGIGAQAKRAMTTGCALKVEVIKAFGKGQEGKLRLRVDKDRQGDVRGHSLPGKAGHWAGDVTISPAPDEDGVDVVLHAPEGAATDGGTPTPFRPTGIMGKVSDYLQANPGSGVREIRDAGLGRTTYVNTALALLVEEGWVRVESGPRGKSEHHVVEAFNELLQPPNDRVPDRAPVCSPEHGQATVFPCSPVQDVVLPTRNTVATREDATKADDVPPTTGTRSRIVERSIGGKRVNFDLDTGEILGETGGAP